MSQKVFFRYNEAHERFERVFPSRRERVLVSLRQFLVGTVLALAVVFGAYMLFELPREKELRQANERLVSQVELLSRRSDEALAVMEDLAARDNNLYRVMLGSDPISPATRYAGLERQRSYGEIDSMSDAELLRTVTAKMDRLDRMIYIQSKSYDTLRTSAAGMADRISHVPAIQPLNEKHLRAMASGYGNRRDPIYGTAKFHEGMDFSAPVGTPVYATGDGTVTTASWQGAYGNMVEINHGYNYTTRYAHLSKMNVRPGQTVKRGDLIGELGNTGKSTGPHLHYEVRLRGVPQNPVNYYFFDLTPDEYEQMIIQAENAGHVMD